MVMVMVMVVVMIWDKSVIWCFFLRPLFIKDKDNLIIFQVTAKLFHSIEKLPCASLTMTWRKPWRTRCIEYAGQAQQSRPSGKFLKEIVRTVLLSGSAFCGPEKYDIGERVKRDVPNIHILDILRYHDEPIEWCFLGFGLNWDKWQLSICTISFPTNKEGEHFCVWERLMVIPGRIGITTLVANDCQWWWWW